MKELSGEHVLLRVLLGESDKTDGKPTYRVLIEMLRKANISVGLQYYAECPAMEPTAIPTQPVF